MDEPFEVVLKRTGERARIDEDPPSSPRARIDIPDSPPGTPTQAPVDVASSQSASHPRATIDAFHQSLAALRAADLANTELQQAGAALYAAAHAARDAGFRDEVQEILDAAAEAAPPRLKMPLNSAYLQKQDREFRHHDVAALDIRRVEFTGGFADVRDLELVCTATAAGSFVPKVTRPGEQPILSIACAIQLFVGNTLEGAAAAELDARDVDASHLGGSLEMLYMLRTVRRAAWGTGICLLTDQRLVGLIFDRDVQGVGSSPERSAMPFALIDADRSGSVLVFTVERAAFDDYQCSTGFLQNRVPAVQVFADECALALDTYRVLDAGDRLVRPGKDVIERAVRQFVPSASGNTVTA